MPPQNRSRATDRDAARERRAARQSQSQTKTNRAQLRAMEVREAATRNVVEDVVVPSPSIETVAGGGGTRTASPRRSAASGKRAVVRPAALSRELEYRFIRSDLRRLGTTAAALFVVMIVLLFVVD